MIVPVSDPQLVFRPLLIAGKILPLRASKSISRGQGRRNGSEPGAQAESLQCISARIVSVPSLLRCRGELLERILPTMCETGGMRRVHLRGHPNTREAVARARRRLQYGAAAEPDRHRPAAMPPGRGAAAPFCTLISRSPDLWGFLETHPMPTAAQITALIRSHAEGDDQRFYSVALQVAAQAARQGHRRFAQELREVIDRARSTALHDTRQGQRTRPVPMVQPRGELAGLLTAAYPKTRLAEMALAADTCSRIERVLTEQRQRAHLQAHGLMPQRRLLLVGLPGTGKTMTATVTRRGAGPASLQYSIAQPHHEVPSVRLLRSCG